MIAGSASPDLGNGLTVNPALVVGCERAGGFAAYARPYGLAGLQWAGCGIGGRAGRFAFAAGAHRLGLGRYSENDLVAVAGAEPSAQFALGVAAHALMVEGEAGYRRVAPGFDAGVLWRGGRVSVAAAGLGINEPDIGPGQALAARFMLGVLWQPVAPLLVAVDLGREGVDESAGAGLEFRLVPGVALRCGVGTGPLRYAGGLALRSSPVGMAYAFRFVPELGATHVFGLEGFWR
jgi:hypothetical protein